VSAIVLKSLNPNRTGKLVLLETNYGVQYKPKNYIFFIILGIAGGLFGAIFCKASLLWTKRIRNFVNKYPLVEVGLIALLTSLLQYPNPVTREPSLLMIKSLLSDCAHKEESWICEQEKLEDKSTYYGWLAFGSAVKVLLTILTTGSRIPSGLIVPALGAGAIFGRLVGQIVHDTSPGIFAMVGASAFLAGVSRMTVSLTVIMLELTGEVEFIPPFMIAILTAKVIVDALHEEGVNDHTVLGEFLEHEHASRIARSIGGTAKDLIPSYQSMQDMTLQVGPEYRVLKQVLAHKLVRMRHHGLRDAGIVLVDDKSFLHGFISESELDFVVRDKELADNEPLDLLSGPVAAFVDRTPLTVNASAPLEMVVEMVYQLGLRHVIITEEDTSKVVGVILKQRLIMYLEGSRKH
jgi:chloride channel 3/4/5